MATIKELKHMCDSYEECSGYSLDDTCCGDSVSSLLDNADEIVDEWVSEHLVKTYALDFLTKFPNAHVDRYKIPKVCRSVIYGNICPKQCNIVSSCDDCWNMEMRE